VTDHSVRRLLSAVSGMEPLVVASGNGAAPQTLLGIADAELASFRLFMLNAPTDIPCRLSMVPELLASRLPPDVVLLNTSRPRRGVVSLGVEVNVLPAAIEAARANGGIVIAQLNRAMPFTCGPDSERPLDQIDAVVEVDEPLDSPDARSLTDQHHIIGARVAELVTDGATLQVGIGAVPDAVLGALRHRRELRVWSEMVSDGVLQLAQAGALGPSAVAGWSGCCEAAASRRTACRLLRHGLPRHAAGSRTDLRVA
jgi:hypothetical protein